MDKLSVSEREELSELKKYSTDIAMVIVAVGFLIALLLCGTLTAIWAIDEGETRGCVAYCEQRGMDGMFVDKTCYCSAGNNDVYKTWSVD